MNPSLLYLAYEWNSKGKWAAYHWEENRSRKKDRLNSKEKIQSRIVRRIFGTQVHLLDHYIVIYFSTDGGSILSFLLFTGHSVFRTTGMINKYKIFSLLWIFIAQLHKRLVTCITGYALPGAARTRDGNSNRSLRWFPAYWFKVKIFLLVSKILVTWL